MRLRAFLLLTLALSLAGSLVRAQGQTDQNAKSQLRRFVVTLALGDVQPGPSGSFTPEAQRALADMKDFLPYKRYTPLDTVYLIGLGGPNQRMRGPDGQQYDLTMRGGPVSETTTQVAMLRLVGVPAPELKTAGMVIDTAFKIEMGETVVVGTSRLDGGRALILLVTSAR